MDYINFLQFFAGEGASAGGDGAGGDGGTGMGGADATPAQSGKQTLLSMGVPASKIRESTAEAVSKLPSVNRAPVAPEAAAQPEAAVQQPVNDAGQSETIKDEPTNPNHTAQLAQLNREKEAAENRLKAMGDTLQKIAQEKGIDLDTSDMSNFDVEAFNRQLHYGEDYVQNLAAELGVSLEAAREMADLRRSNEELSKREEAQRTKHEEEQRVRAAIDHVAKLRQEAEGLKEKYPELDFNKLIKDPKFNKLTSPSGGCSVEDAYWALYHHQLAEKSMAAAARISEQKLANAMSSGSRRPVENGAAPAAAQTKRAYNEMSRKEQLAFKADIERKLMRGEQVPI